MKEVWTKNYEYMKTMGLESVSGTGSSIECTKEILLELPLVFYRNDIRSILDIPCGDFNWMQHLDFRYLDYTGVDVVEELIAANKKKYPNTNFQCLDITSDALPAVDLVISRDCFVHLSYADMWDALENVEQSGAKYLLTTTFQRTTPNQDIPSGGWRTLNLELAPLFFPPPLELINEHCPEGGGIYTDKCLGLWSLASLREIL